MVLRPLDDFAEPYWSHGKKVGRVRACVDPGTPR